MKITYINDWQQAPHPATLLACPFCGQQAEAVIYETGIPQTRHPGARCSNPECFLFGHHWPAEKWQRRKRDISAITRDIGNP